MSDLDNLLRVIARQTPLDWAHHIASMTIIVAWTLHALSRGAGG
jgi:hypothetical protein